MPKKPLTDKSGVVPELTGEDLRGFRPATEVLPPNLLTGLPRRRGAQVTLRLSREALAHVRVTGREAAAHRVAH
jgi:hypothetical protein